VVSREATIAFGLVLLLPIGGGVYLTLHTHYHRAGWALIGLSIFLSLVREPILRRLTR
jgi:hypothetical protein